MIAKKHQLNLCLTMLAHNSIIPTNFFQKNLNPEGSTAVQYNANIVITFRTESEITL